ncbi:MAG: hypothetical protein RLZZ127_1234, partial [Planctomycetota bacterium]
MRLLSLIAAGLCVHALAGGDAPQAADPKPDPKAEIRALHARCLREGDLWTAMQAEAWGRRNGVRLG